MQEQTLTPPTPAGPALTTIPVLECPRGREPALFSLEAASDRAALLLRSARRTYTWPGMWLADTRTRQWARQSDSPYASVVEQVDAALGRTGGYLLNHAYEWGCTTGVTAEADGTGVMLRTLDWPFDGLGQAVVVVRQHSHIGSWLNVTWPGFAGALTGLAPGRFAAAINQPPLPLPWLGKPGGWLAARIRVAQSHHMPPSHLLRLAFDSCETFDQAVSLIRRTPLCIPAVFTLVGPLPGQAVVIERSEREAFTATEPAAANHWVARPCPGRPRNPSSPDRRTAMLGLMTQPPDWSMGWLRPPILLSDTRLAVMAAPATGGLAVTGWERDGASTSLLDLR